MQWRVDWDYVHKLSPEEREWLATFGDAYYSGDFRYVDKEVDWDAAARSDVNRSKNASRTDAHTLAELGVCGGGGIEDVADFTNLPLPGDFDVTPTPSYLDDEDYKEARDAFRAHLASGRKTADPEVTPAYKRALRRLKKVTP